ncbi:type VII secretion target [Amycolatopsis sp. NPDC051371]|uniref:type VII secretion target n=1 Tax=Amycolatopsis sp. NPDC051371 TaxID=3155800 RepID=UPI003416A375
MSSGNVNPFGNAAAGSGFEVYPETLRTATDDIYAASDKVVSFANDDLPQITLRDDDVGMLGVMANVVDIFNQTVAHMRDKTAKGAMQLQRLADALDKAADYYETQDEADFKRLRDQEKGLN